MAVTCLQSPFVFCGICTALRSAYHPPMSKMLKLHHLPNLPLSTPSSWHQSLQGLLWLCACSLFNDTSSWNVVSLQGIISQGARKEHGTDYQKNDCNADILLIGKNLHHRHSKHLILFNCCICFFGKQCLNRSKCMLYLSSLVTVPMVAAPRRFASSLPFRERWFLHGRSAVTIISSHCFLGGVAGISGGKTVC